MGSVLFDDAAKITRLSSHEYKAMFMGTFLMGQVSVTNIYHSFTLSKTPCSCQCGFPRFTSLASSSKSFSELTGEAQPTGYNINSCGVLATCDSWRCLNYDSGHSTWKLIVNCACYAGSGWTGASGGISYVCFCLQIVEG